VPTGTPPESAAPHRQREKGTDRVPTARERRISAHDRGVATTILAEAFHSTAVTWKDVRRARERAPHPLESPNLECDNRLETIDTDGVSVPRLPDPPDVLARGHDPASSASEGAVEAGDPPFHVPDPSPPARDAGTRCADPYFEGS